MVCGKVVPFGCCLNSPYRVLVCYRLDIVGVGSPLSLFLVTNTHVAGELLSAKRT